MLRRGRRFDYFRRDDDAAAIFSRCRHAITPYAGAPPADAYADICLPIINYQLLYFDIRRHYAMPQL